MGVSRQPHGGAAYPPRRHLPRRRKTRCRRGEVCARSPPEPPRQLPPRRTRRRRSHRGGRSPHRAGGPEAAIIALAGPTDGSLGHGGLAESRRGRRQGLLAPSGLRRPIQIRRAGRAGPHHSRTFPPVLGRRADPFRPCHLPADDRQFRPAVKFARGRRRTRRYRADRRRSGDGRSEIAPVDGQRARLRRHHPQHRQQCPRRYAARPRCPGAPGLLPGDRPRNGDRGGVRRPVHRQRPGRRPGTSTARTHHPPAGARRRAGAGTAGRGRGEAARRGAADDPELPAGHPGRRGRPGDGSRGGVRGATGGHGFRHRPRRLAAGRLRRILYRLVRPARCRQQYLVLPAHRRQSQHRAVQQSQGRRPARPRAPNHRHCGTAHALLGNVGAGSQGSAHHLFVDPAIHPRPQRQADRIQNHARRGGSPAAPDARVRPGRSDRGSSPCSMPPRSHARTAVARHCRHRPRRSPEAGSSTRR